MPYHNSKDIYIPQLTKGTKIYLVDEVTGFIQFDKSPFQIKRVVEDIESLIQVNLQKKKLQWTVNVQRVGV